MKIIERLAQYIDFKDISLNAFDISIGASNGYIGKQIKAKGSIGGDIIEKIASVYTDLNIEWLITGSGNMIKNEGKKYEIDTSPPLTLTEKISDLERIIASKDEIIELLKKK